VTPELSLGSLIEADALIVRDARNRWLEETN